MARYRAVYQKIWKDVDFQSYEPCKKLIFLYLCTNELTTESGIYIISPRTIANETGVDINVVTDILNTGIKNVVYDQEHNCVFLRKFRYYSPVGGKPILMKKSILKDFTNTKTVVKLWSIFLKEYPQFSDILPPIVNQPLDNHLSTVDKPFANPPTLDKPLATPLSTVTNQSQTATVDKPLDNPLSTVVEKSALSSISISKNLSSNEGLEKGLPEDDGNNIFTIYMDNITPNPKPMEIEELKSLMEDYPFENIKRAIQEAVTHKAATMAYIKSILRNNHVGNKAPTETPGW